MGAAVSQMAATTEAAAAEAASDAQREIDFISDHLKDHILATKILKQAVAVLSSLEDSRGPSKTKPQPKAVAISELSLAQNEFQAQVKMSSEAGKTTKLNTRMIARRASLATRAFRREQESLELARDAHMTERLRLEDSQRAREAETKEAAVFLQKLAAG